MRALLILLAVGAAASADELPQPVARYIPKAPPPRFQPGKQVATSGPMFGVYYSYVSFAQSFAAGTTVGAGGFFTQEEPALASADSHSLAELAVSSMDGRQVVEIGWTVDPGVNGDDVPHLFVYHWVNGAPSCYNGCGFVQRSATRFPGMRLEVTRTPQELAIRRLDDGNWWLYYQGEGIGYFPGRLWQSFTAIGYAQWFGELASAAEATCSRMGNGIRGSADGAAALSDLYAVASDSTQRPASIFLDALTFRDRYDFGHDSDTGFSFGGSGVSGGGCCVPVTCEELGAQCGRPTDPRCGGNAKCGSCGSGQQCSADFQCVAGPPAQPGAPDAGTAPAEADGGGGCAVASAVTSGVAQGGSAPTGIAASFILIAATIAASRMRRQRR